MNKALLYSLPLLLLGIVSCKDKPKSKIIIAKKPIIVNPNTRPKTVGNTVRKNNISWVGGNYTVNITVKCDSSLPLASDGVNRYYDNRVNVNIMRSDATSFFNHTFSKSDFKTYIDTDIYDKGALLGIIFEKVEGNNLKLAATIGNPDRSSDEFEPLEITVGHLGNISIAKSDNMETE